MVRRREVQVRHDRRGAPARRRQGQRQRPADLAEERWPEREDHRPAQAHHHGIAQPADHRRRRDRLDGQLAAEIFDRLPLLYNTLVQYRPDLEICFAAIGDAAVDQWPLQVTTFASGFDLEQLLGSLYGEGGGGDAPESYGLFAHWVNTHVTIPQTAETPFLIVFGDAPMHPTIPQEQIAHYLGDNMSRDVDAFEAWQTLSKRWNMWFLRRPTGRPGDRVDKQWAQAIPEQKIFHIQDEQRAVDYAMGLIARAWGHFGDFQENMRARQSEDKVAEVSG